MAGIFEIRKATKELNGHIQEEEKIVCTLAPPAYFLFLKMVADGFL